MKDMLHSLFVNFGDVAKKTRHLRGYCNEKITGEGMQRTTANYLREAIFIGDINCGNLIYLMRLGIWTVIMLPRGSILIRPLYKIV